jgi:hypothetical protein
MTSSQPDTPFSFSGRLVQTVAGTTLALASGGGSGIADLHLMQSHTTKVPGT